MLHFPSLKYLQLDFSPSICSVTACLEALKYILSVPLVIQTHLACYAMAQAPHLQDSGEEWEWFTKCVLELVGFQTEDKLKVTTLLWWHLVKYVPEPNGP